MTSNNPTMELTGPRATSSENPQTIPTTSMQCPDYEDPDPPNSNVSPEAIGRYKTELKAHSDQLIELCSTSKLEGESMWIEFVNPFRCLLYTSPSPRDQRGSRMPSSA